MVIDHYATCPCGSGKKLKFCKCVDNLHDLELILKLIEGGQEVAALDRMNQLLAATPNAAWLLALKAELTFAMQELDTFKETVNRFLKLKPDNPLALVLKSIACSFDGEPPETAARYLLNGLSESRETLPSMAIAAIQVLLQTLAARGKLPLIGYWAEILNMLTERSGGYEGSPLMDPNLNLLSKSPAKNYEVEGKSPFTERLNEVLALVRTFRYEQAEKKLQAMLREFPNEPALLTQLLRAQLSLLDQANAHATARKLSEHKQLSLEDRAYYRAISFELEENRQSLMCDTILKYCEIDSEERITEELAKLNYVEIVDEAAASNARQYYAAMVGDEIPARRIFTAFDQPIKDRKDDEETDEIVTSIGSIVLFGKQTDKPSRALLLVTKYPTFASQIAEIQNVLQLGPDFPSPGLPQGSEYVEFLGRSRFRLAKEPVLTIEERGKYVVEEFLTIPWKIFQGKSITEAAADADSQCDVLALLTHLEGEQSIVVEKSAIDEIYNRLNVKRPEVRHHAEGEIIRLDNIIDIERIDLTKLSPLQATGVYMQAISMGATRVAVRVSKHLQEVESLKNDHRIQCSILSTLMKEEQRIEPRLELMEALEQAMRDGGLPQAGQVVLQRVTMLISLGREQEAMKALKEAIQKTPNDPYIMAFLQQISESSGRGTPTLDPIAERVIAGGGPHAGSASGGLVLPGQPESSAPRESKLWLPGS